LGFCKITFMQIESPLKISEAWGYENYFKMDCNIC
jgi:hypothetical protein